MLSSFFKIVAWSIGIVLGLALLLAVYVRSVAFIKPPAAPPLQLTSLEVVQPDSGLFRIGNNWFRKSESGLYELYVEGAAYDLGVANGKLTAELIRYQEDAFQTQIHQLVSSDLYLEILRYFVGYFNRDLANHIPEEYQIEIYGVSHAASSRYDDIAPPYQRILNYHAAHDIGHALQNMSLVGCTSFSTWGDKSEDGSLIIGRNFDFYVGDDFARDKIVAFYNPEHGYNFMMITFGGMTGVVSGMNIQGLTVTLNAAKSEIPFSAATPVSLVAREILQYASTIEDAYTIASMRKTFVAESFLIGSAKDGRAAIIEKTPDDTELFESPDNYIISTNHFQGPRMRATEVNVEHMRTSASSYRYERVKELLDKNNTNSVHKTAAILRDQKGLNDADVGLGNEKVVNQLVAHHGVIFQPEKRLVWVSTAPWQLGKFVCYDLNKVFATKMERNGEIYEVSHTIPADPFVVSKQFGDYLKYSRYRFPFLPRSDLQPDSIVKWNPGSYHAYLLAGDYYFQHENYSKALNMYELGLTKEVATVQERQHMENNMMRCKENLE